MTLQAKRVAVVTGATSGIGRWIALGLMRERFHVVLVGRNAQRGHESIQWLSQRCPQASTHLMLADLRLMSDVHRLALDIVSCYPSIDLLVNNAGMFAARRTNTAEGFDAVLAVNHLAPYMLGRYLEAALRRGAPSRIVNVGSSMSDRARIDPGNLALDQGWNMVRAYAQSKLAMMMCTFHNARRLADSGIVANVAHPGTVASGLVRETGVIGAAWRMMSAFSLTEEQGADTPLHVALSEDWAHRSGMYVKKRVAVKANRRAYDHRLVARVLHATDALVSRFPD
jgi:NAD(P)-dependent dehydrogenase (short-subunit alcohol dehydrogenase family)